MNLCESCKSTQGEDCLAEIAVRNPGRPVKACATWRPITRADLAAKDAEIAELKRGAVMPDLTEDDLNNHSMDCDDRDNFEAGYRFAVDRLRAKKEGGL